MNVSWLAAALLVLLAATSSPALGQPSTKPLMRDFMGINAHTVQFKPELYAPLCRLVRDYHPLQWDIKDDNSADLRPFPVAQHIDWKDASGKFRSWHAPVDWHALYASWQKAGFEVDACVQFDGFTLDKWKDPPADAYRYGKAFAAYFGPSGPNKLVTSVEIGNEPAGNKRYSPEQYKIIFENMARGVREADPRLQIVTCTAEAGETDGWSMPLDTFRDSAPLYDVINVHKYALLSGWPEFERANPEHPKIGYRGQIQKSIDWRDRHAPGKQVWVTEFGFDATTKKPAENNSRWKSSTDLQQAQWIVRSFLFFSEMDVDRAYLYWFNDGDTPSFHAASGVTRNMEPKPSYWAMRHLYRSLGSYRFSRTVEKVDGGAHVFEYVRGDDLTDLVWVAWSATGDGKSVERALPLPAAVAKAERMPTADAEAVAVKVTQGADHRATVTLTESPTYLWFRR